MIDHRSYVLNLSSGDNKTWKKKKNSGLNDLCDMGAALLPTELSSQLRAGHLWVRNIPVGGENIKWIYEIHILA